MFGSSNIFYANYNVFILHIFKRNADIAVKNRIRRNKAFKSALDNFEEYEEGFLIRGLLKKYILVNYSIESLKRILETKFDSVIFLVKDDLSEQDVLAELIRESDEKSLQAKSCKDRNKGLFFL